MTDCLICAGRLDSNNNKNLDTEQMMFIEHKCKFSRLGCEVRIKEDDDINKLHHHEKKCSNRAITCPRVEYKKEVAMHSNLTRGLRGGVFFFYFFVTKRVKVH